MGTRPIIPASGQIEAGGTQFQILPGLQRRLKARLSNLGRPCQEQVRDRTDNIARSRVLA